MYQMVQTKERKGNVMTGKAPSGKRTLGVGASSTTKASPEVVWSLVEDATQFAEWGPWTESGYARPGDASPHGPGAIRRIRLGRTTTIERVLEADAGRKLTYEVVSGLPVRNYTAVVLLTRLPGGTLIEWSARFDRTLLGRIVARKLQQVYDDAIIRLVAAADARADDARSVDSSVESAST
jgi:hypothetical protein